MKMTLLVTSAVAIMMTACSSDEKMRTDVGEARLCLTIGTEDALMTRSLSEDTYKDVANYTVDITDANGASVGSYAGNALPSSLTLDYGTYTIHAYCGAEHDASRDEFLSEDTKVIALASGDTKSVSLVCVPTCGKVAANFDAEMDTYYDDYYVTYETKALGANVATWAKGDTEPWYLLLEEGGETVTATIHLTPKAAYETNHTHTEGSTSEGTVVRTYALQRNRAWTLNIAPEYNQSSGTLGVSISIDESTNDQTVDIVVPSEWI